MKFQQNLSELCLLPQPNSRKINKKQNKTRGNLIHESWAAEQPSEQHSNHIQGCKQSCGALAGFDLLGSQTLLVGFLASWAESLPIHLPSPQNQRIALALAKTNAYVQRARLFAAVSSWPQEVESSQVAEPMRYGSAKAKQDQLRSQFISFQPIRRIVLRRFYGYVQHQKEEELGSISNVCRGEGGVGRGGLVCQLSVILGIDYEMVLKNGILNNHPWKSMSVIRAL